MSETNKPDEFDAFRTIVRELEKFEKNEQEQLIKWTCEKLQLVPAVISSSSQAPQVKANEATLDTPVTSGVETVQATDIRSFVNEKEPKSDIHFAVVVAYYYRFVSSEKKEEISTDDLQQAARLSGRARFAAPSKTFGNAVTSGLLDSAGRGLWKINTVGENLVAIVLPDGDVKSVLPKKKPVKKTPRKTTKTTKKVSKKKAKSN